LVRGSVEETLNELLEAKAEKLTQVARYEHNEQRQGYRSGHYNHNLTTTFGDVTLKVPKLKVISFETAIIERYRRREISVEEALIGMYLACGLDGVKLIVGDKCLGMLGAVGEVFPETKYQRCTVHFYRNVFSVTPHSKVNLVAEMLKVIHAQENKKATRKKAKAVAEELRSMKLKVVAKKVEDGIEETLTYCDFPSEP